MLNEIHNVHIIFYYIFFLYCVPIMKPQVLRTQDPRKFTQATIIDFHE